MQVTNTAEDAEMCPSYNSDGSAITYIVPEGIAAGIYRIPAAGGTRVAVKLGETLDSAFWTAANGKGKVIQTFSLRHLAKFVKPKEDKKVVLTNG